MMAEKEVFCMKRYGRIYGLLSVLLCTVLLLTACGAEAVQQGSSVDSLSSQGVEESLDGDKHITKLKAENVDLGNMDDVTAAMITPLGNYVLQYSWADASGIKADDLIDICARGNLLNRTAEGWNPLAVQVERVLQKYFNVDAEHLRTSYHYSSKLQTYGMHYREEKTDAAFRAISAMRNGSRIEIEIGLTVPDIGEIADKQSALLEGYAAVNYEPYGQDRLIFPSGTMTVEVTEDNTVRFLSYRLNERFQTETEKLARYRKYAEAFEYDLGMKSWNSAKEIEPDALVVYYIYLCGTGEVERPYSGLNDPEFGNPFMFGDALEQAVMSHFDVTPEQIRKSNYYDKERKAYWSGGIGTLVDMEIVGAKWDGKQLTLTMKSSITSSVSVLRWNQKAVFEVDGEEYKYLSYTTEQVENE